MAFSFQTFLYQSCIEPILIPLHRSVLKHVKPADHILDVACGTGALTIALAAIAGQVTGIDLSENAIAAAQRTAHRKGVKNVIFESRDAGDLSNYPDKHFDVAVTSMAIHQFNADLAISILRQMDRIASRMILVDYNHHMPHTWGRSLAWAIEWMAGGDHYQNFKVFMKQGGILHFARQAGISLKSQELRGGGIFLVALTEEVMK